MVEAVNKEDIPQEVVVLDTTWAMKRKANGVRRARNYVRGFKEEPDVHYDDRKTSAPVVSDVTVKVLFVIMLTAGWVARVADVKGAFLLGEFDEKDQQIYIKVPEGF